MKNKIKRFPEDLTNEDTNKGNEVLWYIFGMTTNELGLYEQTTNKHWPVMNRSFDHQLNTHLKIGGHSPKSFSLYKFYFH